MRLILVRHPKPLCEPGLCYGGLDLECEPGDLERAVRHIAELANGMRLVSSPLRRAHDLAKRLAPNVVLEPRLRELHFGVWEGQRWGDIGREAIENWRTGLPDAAPPQGESLTSLAERCTGWLAEIRAQKTDVLAVTHAGPIRVLRAIVRREPILTYFNKPIAYGSALELQLPV